jgi:hypothetical protein
MEHSQHSGFAKGCLCNQQVGKLLASRLDPVNHISTGTPNNRIF